MSQNNGGGGAAGALAALLLFGYILFWVAVGVGVAVYSMITFFAVIITLICLFAWNRPRRLFHLAIAPYQARGIVCFGVIGMILFPAFGLWVEWLFAISYPDWMWFHFFLGGYALGAHYFWERQSFDADEVERLYLEARKSEAEYLPPPPRALPAPPAKPFEYASWNDEGAPTGYDPNSKRCQGCALRPDPNVPVFRR